MEEVIRNVAEIDDADRRALEHLIGKHLAEHQQVIISVIEVAVPQALDPRPPQSLADWTHVYDGLSEEEIEAVDKIAKTRANLTRNLP
jgi:hypothetical protein